MPADRSQSRPETSAILELWSAEALWNGQMGNHNSKIAERARARGGG
jgi:hypothetical protein